MNEEMNIHDEFEKWLKQSADKHKMYPSDKLWRNINSQLHEQPNWPALTFGAILTLAFITATLIFLHPNKDLFTIPNYASNSTLIPSDKKSSVNTFTKQTNGNGHLKPLNAKAAIYSFNYTEPAVTEEIITNLTSFEQVGKFNEDLPELTEPSPILDASVLNASAKKVLVAYKAADVDVENESVVGTSESNLSSEKTSALADAAEELDQTANVSRKTINLSGTKKKHWSIEVYGGSNISYRRLVEPSAFNYHSPYNQTLTSNERNNVNNVVNQKPSVGFNIGAAFVYAVSDRVRIKAGLQFNYRQYNIDAYKATYERSVLLLNNGFYYPDSVFTYSVISNEKGKAISLSNRYYQVGIPVGLEWTAVKMHNVSFNLAANVQPTYQINSNNYLITSDYKSYVQAPGLLRRVNINAGAEATANFNAGNLQWQIGPQLMYQTLPTQKDNYSIREHLIDYGVRVGVIKHL